MARNTATSYTIRSLIYIIHTFNTLFELIRVTLSIHWNVHFICVRILIRLTKKN